MNTIVVCLLFLLQLYLFFSFGLLINKLGKLKLQSMTMTLFLGFSGFFCLFGVVAIPMIFNFLPLSTLTYTTIVIICIILVVSLCINFKQYSTLIKDAIKKIIAHSYFIIVLFVSVFLLELIVFSHIDWSADASYYIGKVSTDVYTNTMGQYSPYTGQILAELDSRRIFACFQEYNAVIAQFFNIHPLKQAKLIMPQLLVLFTAILYYNIGIQLFNNNRKKAALFVGFVVLLDIFSNTAYTNANFLLNRTYEGKSILANIIIPGLFYCFLLLWKNGNNRTTAFLLLTISFSSCIFTASSMLIVPVSLTVGMIPWILKERKWKQLIVYSLCIAPNLFVCMMYLLSSKGFLTYPIGG